MAIVQCQNGHNYDNSKNAQCPYCTGSATIGITVPLGSGYDSAAANPIVNAPAPEFPKTAPVYGNQIEDNSNNIPVTAPYENKTVGIFVNEQGISNVCGWLVFIEGKKKGKDFRVHGERNFIGRAKSNDICLDFDDKISTTANAILSYDNEENIFYIQPGENQKNNVRLNGKLLLVPTQINNNDIIKLGDTQLMFIAFCNDSFKWE
jgi:hypothetical protein